MESPAIYYMSIFISIDPNSDLKKSIKNKRRTCSFTAVKNPKKQRKKMYVVSIAMAKIF